MVAEDLRGVSRFTGADFLFVCKRDSRKTLYEFLQGAPLGERSVNERGPGNRSLADRCRWIEAAPLRDGKDALNVNRLGSASSMPRERPPTTVLS
ncbi:MAG: hypothetical protein ACYCSN_01900 [Acidobacteriaceae bacterium]